MALATEQIWQAMGANESDHSPSHELLQLDMATLLLQQYSDSTDWISHPALGLG